MSKKILAKIITSITFSIFLFAGIAFTGSTSLSGQVNFFLGTLDDLERNAGLQEKYYVLFFEADWCEPCKRMQKEVFTDVKVGNLMKKKFLLKKINGEHEAYIGTVQDLYIQSYPTTIVFNADGGEVLRLVGYYDKNDFINEMKAFVPGSKRTMYSDFR